MKKNESFDDSRIKGGEVDKELKQKLDKERLALALSRAETILDKDAVNPSQFSETEGYDANQIELDLDYIKVLEAKFRGHPRESRILEALIHEQGEKSNWFGESAFTTKTSEFDDVKHGVDEIVEFKTDKPETQTLALAIDVTFGRQTLEKLSRIKREINEGTLAQIDYFVSQIDRKRKRLKGVPHVIIETERETVEEMARLWVNPFKKQEIANHSFQYIMLYQIREQLRFFSVYALKVLKQGETAKSHLYALKNIEEIIARKEKENPEATKYREASDVQQIRIALKNTFREISDSDFDLAA